MSEMKNFLIIDDSESDRGHLRAVLHIVRGYGIDVREANSSSAAVEALREGPPDIVFADHLSPTETAFVTIEKLRGEGYEGPIVVVTGHGDPIRHRQLRAAGALEVLMKDDLDAAAMAKLLADLRSRPD
jgi:CheY-like chemotaxis protein